MNDTIDKVRSALVDLDVPHLARVLGDFHTNMTIADEETKAAQARHPEHADVLGAAFPSLARPPALAGKAHKLYRAHCRELLNRVARGDDIDVATRAEVTAVLCEMAMASRLIPDAEHLYLKLFLDLGLTIPGTDTDELRAQALSQFTWNPDGQNRVFSDIVRHLDAKRPRSEVKTKGNGNG